MPPSRVTLAAIHAPFVVERYAVYDEFAAGGMASVHFARLNGAHGFRRTVAVKRLLPHLTRDRDFALMLIDEARLASRVRHHNVVSILDVVQTADELLLVMEYVHGESLAKLMRWSSERHEPVPVAIAVAIMTDALHGLHAAHEATDEQGVALGLVHRDVSPQNVLVGLDGITRIADFGVAKAAGRVQSTRDGTVKGKLAYMAPEQIGGGDVSPLSDVFAAAVVLWEVLTGARLFAGANDAERVFKVMSAPIPRPSTRRAGLPAALDAIVLRGLERDPARRCASAREMALALERAAPAVRPSEIASWVERAVAGRLAERARMLRAIERGEDGETDAFTALRERVAPSDPWDAEVSAHTLPEAVTGTRRNAAVSQGASNEREPSMPAGSGSVRVRRSAQGAGRRSLIGAGVLGLLALLSALAWTVASHRVPAAQAVQAVTPEQGVSLSTPTTLRPSAPAATALAAPPVDDAASALGAAVPTKTQAAPRNEKRRPRPAHKSSPPACDPPYSIDTAGRVLFKVECM
jgi:eukaryotic-like serine/threonine-protein kinase